MIKKFLKSLEDPNRPLLGPNIKALQFWGLLLPKNNFYKYLHMFFNLCVTAFITTEFVDIWFVKEDINLVLENLKLTLMSTMSISKAYTFLFWQDRWIKIINFVTNSDNNHRQSSDRIKREIIRSYTKYSRIITYFYWIITYATVFVVVSQPFIKYIASSTYRSNLRNGTESYTQIASSWTPFNKNALPGYLVALTMQIYATTYGGGGWITSFDTNAIVIMVFFRGELELLRRDAACLFGEVDSESDEIIRSRFKELHHRYTQLLKHTRLFDSCLSPIMLLYMFVCAVMLCVTAYQITTMSSPMEQFLTAEYLMFGVAQLFMFCWHSNNVLYTSRDLRLGPYESKWWAHNSKMGKDLCILTHQFSHPVEFSAGPFSKLHLSTFIAILKGAYSYYTLLSQSQM